MSRDATAIADTSLRDTSTPHDSGRAIDGGWPVGHLDAQPSLDSGATGSSRWLETTGNRIVRADGRVWRARGANIHDTRSCNACAWAPPNVDEVKRRVDELVSWGANVLRLDLESYGSADGRAHWQGVLDDPAYLADVRSIVDHIGTKPDVYVLVSLWIDPSFSALGWPTAQTRAVWRRLAEVFARDPHVLYGLVNEPQHNYDGAYDSAVWTAMDETVAAIRDVETSLGAPNHIVAVQGTGGWARFLSYYMSHPIRAGNGRNVAYEVHVYDPASTFQERFIGPSSVLPVIIGEFGPAGGMSTADCVTLMDEAERLEVPYLSWTFHMRCPPNLLEDYSNGSCGVGTPLQPTSGWGVAFKNRLATPW